MKNGSISAHFRKQKFSQYVIGKGLNFLDLSLKNVKNFSKNSVPIAGLFVCLI